jgi:hypothetical protein
LILNKMETKSVVSLTIFIFICICFVRCQKNLPKFRPFHGLRIKTTYLRLNLSSMTPCCMACTSDKLCKSVNYDQKCACELNLVSPDSTAADLVEDNEWTLSFTENRKLLYLITRGKTRGPHQPVSLA